MKKILALVLAALMLIGMTAAFADNPTIPEGATSQRPAHESGLDSEFTGTNITNTAETTITVTNITEGDSVEYWQLVEWDADNTGWKLTSNTVTGIALTNLLDGINETEASTIAGAFTAGQGTAIDLNGTTASADVDPGLYYVKVTPGASSISVYNPIFVSADYYVGGNVIDALTDKVANTAVAKKSDVPFDKKVDNANPIAYADVKPGDVIPFEITTHIPSYGTSYTNPVFTISDTLSDILTLNQSSISVAYGASSPATETVEDVVTITPTAQGFTVVFDPTWLSNPANTDKDVTITYTATVDTVTDSVNYMDNKATLTYTNKPNTTVDKDDITRHYTFSIDGGILGQQDGETDELIKVACDAEGNPIYDTTTTYYPATEVNPLDGATFRLTPVTGSIAGGVEYLDAVSANGGHITFLGLDAGTYTLQEISAPTGYMKDQRTYTVEIVPHYDNETVDYPILTSYDVKFYNQDTLMTTSTFTTNNMGETTRTVTEADDSQFIGNTPGAELPSTGGIGTTLFYVGGGILVLLAVVLLVTKRRMTGND